METPKLDLLNWPSQQIHINYMYFKEPDDMKTRSKVKVSNLTPAAHRKRKDSIITVPHQHLKDFLKTPTN